MARPSNNLIKLAPPALKKQIQAFVNVLAGNHGQDYITIEEPSGKVDSSKVGEAKEMIKNSEDKVVALSAKLKQYWDSGESR